MPEMNFVEGVIGLGIEVRIHPREMKRWEADRISRFFFGLAVALSAISGDGDPEKWDEFIRSYKSLQELNEIV